MSTKSTAVSRVACAVARASTATRLQVQLRTARATMLPTSSTSAVLRSLATKVLKNPLAKIVEDNMAYVEQNGRILVAFFTN
jgi:Na+/serine symporter